MISFKENNLNELRSKPQVILYGAGMIGRLVYHYLNENGINIDFFLDSDRRLSSTKVGEKKIFTLENCPEIKNNSTVFLTNSYFLDVVPKVKSRKITNIFSCENIIDKINFQEVYKSKLFFDYQEIYPLEKIIRHTNFYKDMLRKDQYKLENYIYIKSLDVQVTEKCSAKCLNCSNLMHYYSKPKDANNEDTNKSLDVFMSVVDQVDELRIIGGDPFMNKDLHKTVYKLLTYENAKKVVVYTNAKIVPKNENLKCLKNSKVVIDISNYKNEASKNYEKLVEVLRQENINFTTNIITQWQDCGRVLPDTNEDEKQLAKKFVNCCNSELISMLHGKIYRCPFSANLSNISKQHNEPKDSVNLLDENINKEMLKEQIFNLVYNKDYLSACRNCNGRDYTTKWIDAAVQLKVPNSLKI